MTDRARRCRRRATRSTAPPIRCTARACVDAACSRRIPWLADELARGRARCATALIAVVVRVALAARPRSSATRVAVDPLRDATRSRASDASTTTRDARAVLAARGSDAARSGGGSVASCCASPRATCSAIADLRDVGRELAALAQACLEVRVAHRGTRRSPFAVIGDGQARRSRAQLLERRRRAVRARRRQRRSRPRRTRGARDDEPNRRPTASCSAPTPTSAPRAAPAR